MAKSKIGLTLALGALLGGAAAFFLSPKSGKENREMAKKKWASLHTALQTKSKEEIVKEIFGSASNEGKKLYEMAQKEMNTRLDELKTKYPDIDKGKYMEVVKEVIGRLKDEKEATKERMSDLGEFLKSRWEFISEEGKKDLKKAKAPAKKKAVNK
ncbi:hypothetical protein CO051_04380 [Candidatus Roizmanbacteria bacterium CG_4_9_14_0_2_um_filter_39_13]|uniref:YtxH domain-containing protein n=2 Tax=Candidatus Roizmaniibacteriota TaxID=1752723 RepID=A0A2M8EY41_9BACT|nr:MAG: hypothetical protein COY15_05470 [Candidatus Roizmanbacteria bacterium CG_4_10_14_0_2_um_filter_39_12]PJC31108.1 MAG: hypothetical protein CO051_04380 [Candidatus Roizmanbacteria bacterium CG_4_9_14_0_2_um_filter_39_13]PJE61437.1 MAG: hypothetical protein COU87_04525 [Candidatus Roizmanbacteria bacterium CG10_big_fil_rev_8_21_14_0_10_39_12]